MPPYFALALIWSLTWLLCFLIRKETRVKMLIMSFAVIPFAFFDYFSQPSYWHPSTFFSLPVGIEGVLFGFAFGGVAAVIHSDGVNNKGLPVKEVIDRRNILALVPVLIISIGLYSLFGVNMMISLPLGLAAGCLIIVTLRPDLLKKLLYSGLSFGVLYVFLLAGWLLLFPKAQAWWDLRIYGDITIFNVPFGEVLFGFLFSAFWGTLYEFVFNYSIAPVGSGVKNVEPPFLASGENRNIDT